jgi:hypothetical protein
MDSAAPAKRGMGSGIERLDRKGLPPTRGALLWHSAMSRKLVLAKLPDNFTQAVAGSASADRCSLQLAAQGEKCGKMPHLCENSHMFSTLLIR